MLPTPHRSVEEALCPISDAMLSRLYRGDEPTVDKIGRSLSLEVRARLALFCYSRSHLREKGRQLASAFNPADFALLGPLGKWLSHMPADTTHISTRLPKVTVATAADMRAHRVKV